MKKSADQKCSDKNNDVIVKISLPEQIPKAIKQIKINKLYDILKPKTKNNK